MLRNVKDEFEINSRNKKGLFGAICRCVKARRRFREAMFSASECNRNNAAILRFAKRYDVLSELCGILTTLFAINLIANTFCWIGILGILAALF